MNARIPESFLHDLLTRVDLVEFIDSYVPLKKRGTSYLACCPFHSEKNPSFNVIAKKQFYHCFGCGVSGNAISFAMNYLNQPFLEAVETLARRVGMQVPRTEQKNTQLPNLYALLQRVTDYYQTTLQQKGAVALTYLTQRGVDALTATRYQLGYAPAGWHALDTPFKHHKDDLITTGMLIKNEQGKVYDRYRHRLMFPIHDQHGRVIGFGGRALDDEEKPKYLNSPETPLFQKSRELYGLHQVLSQEKNPAYILIVEGYMDVIALSQHGIPHAVATLGTATSAYHVQRLSKHTQHLVFCFDGDTAGRQAAWKALDNTLAQLDSGIEAAFVFLPDGHDPDSLIRQEGRSAFEQRIHNATPLHQFFLDTLMQPLDIHTLAGKSELIRTAKPALGKIPEGPYKQLMMHELARRTRLESHRIEQWINQDVLPFVQTTHQPIQRTPLRLATALLLQHPELYTTCFTHLKAHPIEGNPVFKAVLHHLEQHPKLNTAALIESFRDDSMFDILNKLAAWEHQVPEETLQQEFLDIVVFLSKKDRETQIQRFIEKSRQQPLSEEERQTLQSLLKKQHQPRSLS